MDDSVFEEAIDSRSIRIVICERSNVQRNILRSIIARAGYCIHTVASSLEALEYIEANPTDILMTGIEVGNPDGIELCWRLKSSPETQTIYSIVTTASENAARVAEALDSGADDFIRKPIKDIELQARLRAAVRIIHMQRVLRGLATTDPLTGVPNRRAFFNRLEEEASRTRRHDEPLSVMMLDLDHFKAVNDTHGHGIGDDVLKATAAVLMREVRDHDVVGRLGGEEFAVVMPHTDLDGALILGERIRRAVAEMEVALGGGETLTVTGSIGVALHDPANPLTDNAMQNADAALYEAKEGGRNRVCQYQEAADRSAVG